MIDEPAATYAPLPIVTGAIELRVAADERAVADHRLVLVLAVVVARDGAGADVDVVADGGIAQVREVAGLRLAPQRRLLQLDEVADVGLALDDAARAQVRERAERPRRTRPWSP